MRTIWKYRLALADSQTVRMPRDSKLLSVDMQKGIICLWAIVDTGEPEMLRFIRICGTGSPAPNLNAVFIGTVQDSPLVWHVFEEPI